MADVLIDLGPDWGHVVPLSVLEEISHIELLPDGHIHVTCEFPYEEKRRPFKFKSRKKFSDEEGEKQKNRLFGYSTGLISREDVEQIMKTMEAQTGVEYTEILKEPVYDIKFIRRIWATHMGEPYFRFILQFDPETQTVSVEDHHNEEFQAILPDWLGADYVRTLGADERLIMFAYETIYRLAEPFLPEDEHDPLMDPMANIPVMGVKGVETTVDLANMSPDQVMATTGGNS